MMAVTDGEELRSVLGGPQIPVAEVSAWQEA